ncbi:MAG: extracellular solute-binding protein [Clostridiales bacterium]|nr:extracellular solute-binding protein [Clostridiales bacterium]
MKTKKIIALMLSLAMVIGVAACSNDVEAPAETGAAAPAETTAAAETPAETEAAPAETQDATVDASAYNELAIADVADEDDEVVVYGFNEEVKTLIETYSDISVRYEQQTSDTIQQVLDNVLASGEDAPDLFACDADYARKYMNSDNTLPINDLGIAYSELTEMYNYTLQFATDDENIIKGLAWQACPCGVFYNRTVAQNTLGVSEPEDVAPYFESWDAFLETARTVAAAGDYAIISSTGDIFRSILNSRTSGWIVNGQINIDPVMEDYFDLAKTLHDEGLTHETSQWSDAWTADMSNETVLSYWGPMWLARFSMALDPTAGDNPTSGDWGIVAAPGDFYWGGTWLMASKYCNSKASVAQIMRDICIDADNLQTMADGGEFVNSIAIMTAIGNDASFALEWLGGQNPVPVLLDAATQIDNSIITENDGAINDQLDSVVTAYINGDIATVAEAEDAFIAAVEDAGIV